nr:T9SS type A sorting domain-containing protein [Portibacter marinus]
MLNAFINQVEAKRGKDLTDAEADNLIAVAQIIINAINSGDSDCGASSLKKTNEGSDLFDDLQINVFPNPSSYETSINFNLNMTQKVSVQLVNLSGQRIKQIESRAFNKGPQQIKFQTKDLENGIYFIVIQTPHSMSSKKISIIK